MAADAADRPELAGLDPASVTAARGGNDVKPGLALFTGLSFLVYLLVKAASGATPVDAGLFAQVAVAAALTGVGGGLMKRARYFTVTLEAPDGPVRLKGLSRAEQQAILARFAPDG